MAPIRTFKVLKEPQGRRVSLGIQGLLVLPGLLEAQDPQVFRASKVLKASQGLPGLRGLRELQDLQGL